MNTEEKSVLYQIVDKKGIPANNFIYTDLEFAEGYCEHLSRSYGKLYAVRNVFLRDYELR